MTTTKMVIVTKKDISEETLERLLDGMASYSACGATDSGLFFTIETLSFMIEEDFYEEPLDELIRSEIKNLIEKMEKEEAYFLFLN